MRGLKLFLSLILSVLCASCSYISDHNIIQSRDSSYLTAQSTRPLKIPPGIDAAPFDTRYPVPPMEYSKQVEVPDLTPPELYVSKV